MFLFNCVWLNCIVSLYNGLTVYGLGWNWSYIPPAGLRDQVHVDEGCEPWQPVQEVGGVVCVRSSRNSSGQWGTKNHEFVVCILWPCLFQDIVRQKIVEHLIYNFGSLLNECLEITRNIFLSDTLYSSNIWYIIFIQYLIHYIHPSRMIWLNLCSKYKQITYKRFP